ncbi:MAG: glycyl-radical enzyme activating protein [Clostridiales bacterium]|nr:glycyl-radical enzyme activating protein [Clostridiales bacterium]
MQGIVFDIRRFSTHDGDGIRTTVFMKGCPLRCLWCQNPEGLEPGIAPIYFENQCIHCGGCQKRCRPGNIEEKEGRLFFHRHRDDDWERIAQSCPANALRLDAKYYQAEELAEEIKKDKVFFSHGGGVTFSGGEPLMQAPFVGEVMKILKKEGIHTAIETSLAVSEEAIMCVLPYTDQIFADMKVDDEADHKRMVGATNRGIKANLTRILRSGYRDRITVRTPLIPEFTATEKNLSAIAEFLSGLYPNVHYELLNYNPLAEAKYHLVDFEYCFEKNQKLYTKEEMLRFGEIVRQHGIRHLIME